MYFWRGRLKDCLSGDSLKVAMKDTKESFTSNGLGDSFDRQDP